jgi:hypothetical protein
MAKSSYSRHQAQKIKDRWEKLHKHLEFIPENSLSFGKIFKQDPLDCGNPKCNICSYSKVFHKNKLNKNTNKYNDYENI